MKVYNIAKVFELVLCLALLFFAITNNRTKKWKSEVRAIVKAEICFIAIVMVIFEFCMILIEKDLGTVWIPSVILFVLWCAVSTVNYKKVKE